MLLKDDDGLAVLAHKTYAYHKAALGHILPLLYADVVL
jgi:hypothetical protein